MQIADVVADLVETSANCLLNGWLPFSRFTLVLRLQI